ncbi:Flp pilus assembly protein TadG [Yoonia maritima]|uniref:Flp pilus assembly protein TadG n=1 Tax=Yoonia maritima TaxID=1435347 RepID=A0A2T0W3I3_9RHOB|nr:TadE/TadG family type IV pilus assembly protein [Yoonia maritima]PRY79771.1 Flp pilus assembly protein TadG [Yoonia maritima]
MPMMFTQNTRSFGASKSQDSLRKRFAADEDGSILIMTILLLVAMLIMGGMAVDFMRFESRRAEIQGVADRAVLSAASMRQELDSADVITDFFEKAGYADALDGEPIINNTGSSKSVQVNAIVDVDTYFLKLAGIDVLAAAASSRAIEGVGDIEISLVLDISGSMDNRVIVGQEFVNAGSNGCSWKKANWYPGYGNGCFVTVYGDRKIDLLRSAATDFVTTVLEANGDPDDPDTTYRPIVSVSLVNYSANVSVGDELFDAINVAVTTSQDPEDPESTFINPSRCIDFDYTDFQSAEFDTSRAYRQTQYFDVYSNSNVEVPIQTTCPNKDYEGIIPFADQPDAITDAISKLQPTLNTSIHLGMKWGVSLLDPSMQDIIEDVDSVHEEFRGTRPLNYAEDSGVNTLKYVILMTDGENVDTIRLVDDTYDEYEEHVRFRDYTFNYWWYNVNDDLKSDYLNNSGYFVGSRLTETAYTSSQADTLLSQICTKAKEADIIVYSIAMGATSHGEDEMEACASEPKSRYYNETAGNAIDEIFEGIAEQITDLRLNL